MANAKERNYGAKPITQPQRRVLYFVAGYIYEHGESPTHREICEELEFKNIRSVAQFLEALEDKSFLTIDPDAARKKGRSIQLISN